MTSIIILYNLIVYVACTTNEVRLVEGFANDGSDGRVEFCLNGQWTTICNDDNTWNSLDSQVVCSQVGVPQSSKKSVKTC